jgi:16S rRNA (cytidine1402-2'-O)-methyltransferase
MQSNKCGTLYIIATPIGNLGDMTMRAISTLQQVELIACEDTRVSSKLCSHFNIKTPLISYHDHNELIVLPKLLDKLQSGADVALISDAGTPLISDPGFRLVQQAVQAGVNVSPIAGACSIIAALSASGMPTDRFYFAGFLPNKAKARLEKWKELSEINATIITLESVHRLSESLCDAAQIIPNRGIVVAREISKLYEEFRRGTIAEVNQYYAKAPAPKGEIVLIISPPDAPPAPTNQTMETLIKALLPTMSAKEIANILSDISQMPRKLIYNLILKIKDE